MGKSINEINEMFFDFIRYFNFDRDVIKDLEKRSKSEEISIPKFVCDIFRRIIVDTNPEIKRDIVEANSIRRECNYRIRETLKDIGFDKEIIDFLHSESRKAYMTIAFAMDTYLYYEFGIDEKRKKKIRTRKTDRFSFGRQINAFY